MKDIPLLPDAANQANYDPAPRFRIATLVCGQPGFVEYRGMPWMRNILRPSSDNETPAV